MVDSNPIHLNDLDEPNLIDGYFNCIFRQGDGGQADVWYAQSNQGEELAVKVFRWGATRERN
jgi:RIO-like serine/threonine protein kinase